MPSLDLSLLLNPSHWIDGDPGSASAWYWLLVVLFAALSVAGGVSYSYLRPGSFAGHALHARMAEVAGMAMPSWGCGGSSCCSCASWASACSPPGSCST